MDLWWVPEVSVLAPGVTQDRDIIQRWTAFGVLMVIAEWLLGFPAVRQRLTSNEYLIITSASLSIGTASAVLIEHAGRFTPCRIWARNVAMASLFRMCGRNRPAPVSNFRLNGMTYDGTWRAAHDGPCSDSISQKQHATNVRS